jgi:hypothetical protein
MRTMTGVPMGAMVLGLSTAVAEELVLLGWRRRWRS